VSGAGRRRPSGVVAYGSAGSQATRRWAAVAIVAVLLAGCAAISGPPTVAPATPAASPGVTLSPTAGPTPTASLETVSDLVADPLPGVSAGDLLAVDPQVQGLVELEGGAGADAAPYSKLAGAVWLCRAGLARASAADRELEQLTGCLLAIAIEWQAYRQTTAATAFEDARTIYAYAAGQPWSIGRAGFDSLVTSGLAALNLPPASPDGAALHAAADLLATAGKKASADAVERATFEALTTDGLSWASGSWAAAGVFGDGYLVTSLGACLYPGKYLRPFQVLDCASLVGRLWDGYLATGSGRLYQAAVATFRYGYALAAPYASGSQSRQAFLDAVRTYLANP
jgi:hypothetical protein